MMRVWLIQIGEPLPIDGEVPRLLRTGVLAQQLADRGHDVTWWCSTFNHWTKSHRYRADTTIELQPNYRLRLLHSPGYRRNVSLSRVFDHRILASRFEAAIERDGPPDVILSSFPTVEMSEAAAVFGNTNNVPVIVDVRDLWPDAFLNLVPGPLRPLAKLLLFRMSQQARRALARSDAIVGVSESYLEWALNNAHRKRRKNDAVFPLGYERSSPSRQELQQAEHRLRDSGIDPERVVCWFIGTFGRTYDLETVIQVARGLHERHDYRAQFVLSGDGGGLEECRKLAAGLPNVVFTGWVNSTEIEWLMTVADIGLAAYVRDAPQSLPNKLFEYLAAGLPILSSLGREAAELLHSNNCGFTYEPGNTASLLDRLVRLLDDPQLMKAMSAAARETFDAKYSNQRIYQSLIELIERLGNAKTSRAGTHKGMKVSDGNGRRLIGPAITDVPGERADSTQIERLVARYHWTSAYCADRDVLEVACGSGQGLGLLRSRARRIFACDLSIENLASVTRSYERGIPLAQSDAQSLPFADGSLDVVVLLEAIYFLPDADAFMSEARRVLRTGGLCLLSAVNKDCPDFNPTHSLYYRCYGRVELAELLARHGFAPECAGIIPMNRPSLRRRAFKPLKTLAIKAHLIPETMRARRYVKRLVFGRLDPMPANIVGLRAPGAAPTPLPIEAPDLIHQVILCAGRLK